MTNEQKTKVETHLRDLIEGGNVRPKDKFLFEQAFLIGACSVLEALFPNTDPNRISETTPSSWIMMRLCGRSILE